MINEKEFKKLCNSYAIADSDYHEAIFNLEILQETVDNLKWIIEDYRSTREHIHEQILEAMTGQWDKFANETIAHQSVTEMAVCPNCNGSGVYQEYDEYDRYHVFACYKCEGTGEIARQSVTSEEVAEAIEQFTKR